MAETSKERQLRRFAALRGDDVTPSERKPPQRRQGVEDPRTLRAEAKPPPPAAPDPSNPHTAYWWFRGVPEERGNGPWLARECRDQNDAQWHLNKLAQVHEGMLLRTANVEGGIRYKRGRIDPTGEEKPK